MVNANELRIGNWVKWMDDGHAYKIEMTTFYTEVRRDEGRTVFDQLEPIPLTPEILLACGRIGTYPYSLRVNKEWSIEFRPSSPHNDKCFLYSPVNGFGEMCVPWFHLDIKYLHQLQNVFFSLTQEELTYKPMKLKN